MTNKEFAYVAQQRFRDCTGRIFKRAHVHELLAALFGFKSYAALSAEAVFTSRLSIQELSAASIAAIRARCLGLGYPHATAEFVSSGLIALVAEFRIDVVRLDDLIAELGGESSLAAAAR